MFSPLPASSALAQALSTTFSTLSRRGGDVTILHPVLQRLTSAGAIVADLRDLRAAALDELPEGFLRAPGQPSLSHRAQHPALVALPEGCAASTVNRFLRELSGTECISAPRVDARRDLVDFPVGTALRLFETTEPPPYLCNLPDIPVLFRLSGRAPSCVPQLPAGSDAAATRLSTVAALRAALGSEDCRLELPPAAAFGMMASQLADLIDAWRRRLDADAGRMTGPPAAALPNADEQITIGHALRMVPRELLPAPASIAIQDLLLRMHPLSLAFSPGSKPGLDERDLSRIASLLEDQWQIACPPRGEFRPTRSPRDLVTLARLQRWVWPDIAYVKAARIDDPCKARSAAANSLRADWEARQGFDRAMKRFADLRVPLPDADLLRRLGVLQAEALTARHRSRRVTFADPLTQADDPT